MKVRAAQLAGQQLNNCVAVALGAVRRPSGMWTWPACTHVANPTHSLTAPDYAGDWAHAGPLLRRLGEHVELKFTRVARDSQIPVTMLSAYPRNNGAWFYVLGATETEALARLFVRLHLGEEVELSE